MTRPLPGFFHAIFARGLGRNTAFALAQSLITLASMLLVYRVLIAYQGLAALGLWSLLTMFSGIATAFDVSGASALARSVARHENEFFERTPTPIIHTVLITSLAINGVLLLLLLALAAALLPHLVEPAQLAQAWELVPWVAGLMLVNPLAVGLTSSIDGLMRADQRAMLMSAAALIGAITAVALIPNVGVVGIAIAQAIQQMIVIGGAWTLLRWHVDDFGWIPRHWKRTIFRQTTAYAVKMNVVGVLGLLFEPVTKYCLTLSGGTTALGAYELAARLVVQLRNLAVSSTVPLVPVLAGISENENHRLATVLTRAQRLIVPAALGVALMSLLATPIMCLIILGHFSMTVLRMGALLTWGWSINLIALPLYLVAQAQGQLRWNIASHALIGLTVVATTAIAPRGEPLYIVTGIAAGLAAGALCAITGNAVAFGVTQVVARWPAIAGVVAIVTMACTATFAMAPALASIRVG